MFQLSLEPPFLLIDVRCGQQIAAIWLPSSHPARPNLLCQIVETRSLHMCVALRADEIRLADELHSTSRTMLF